MKQYRIFETTTTSVNGRTKKVYTAKIKTFLLWRYINESDGENNWPKRFASADSAVEAAKMELSSRSETRLIRQGICAEL